MDKTEIDNWLNDILHKYEDLKKKVKADLKSQLNRQGIKFLLVEGRTKTYTREGYVDTHF